MIKALTNSQMRRADEYTIKTQGISSEQLMHRAGVAIAEEVYAAYNRIGAKQALIVCGTGNNGGDGFVCASQLLSRGINVKVFCFEGKLSPDCAREKAKYDGEFTKEICGDIIVDCIFGTGLSRDVDGEYYEVIQQINTSGAFVVSADIPSGLNGDNGKVMKTAVKADVTVAIAEYKCGFYLNDGPDYCGKIIKKDIGIVCPNEIYANIFEDNDIACFYPRRNKNSHKGTYGTANLIAGCSKYIGAAALSAEAALKSGCGYVKLTTGEKVINALVKIYPQIIFQEADLNADCIAIGMGCGIGRELYSRIKYLLDNYEGVLIIDADALNSLAKFGVGILKNKKCEAVLTPHLKEFSRLTGKSVEEISADPITIAKSSSSEYGVTVLLKSAASIICRGEEIVINVRGDSSLAKAGSGDMLSGLICGTVARGVSPFESAVCASYTLGLSAEITSKEKTEYCATAKDIIKNLHKAVIRLTEISN